VSTPLNVGLVGFGIAAQVMHAPFLSTLNEYRLVSVLERNESNSKKRYPNVTVVRTIDELLENSDIDIIVITTPNDTHFEYTKKSLLANKHVVVEKPFTNTSEDAMSLINLAKKTNCALSIFQNRRYVNDFLTIKKILNENLLGEIVEFEGHYDRYRPEAKPNAWREKDKPGSGILFDLGAHLIDQALTLFGIPKTITADIRKQRPHSVVDDYFDIRLDYGFTKIILESGMLVREPGPRYMIHGTNGSFIKSGEDPQEALLKAGVLPNIPKWGEEPEENWGLLHTSINGKVIRDKYPSLPGNYGYYYLDLYETIRNGADLKVKPEQGFNTIRIIELAFESNRKKCTIACEGLISSNY
jgi:scyllo-inositol 2-dehydrogenase (NADP+)